MSKRLIREYDGEKLHLTYCGGDSPATCRENGIRVGTQLEGDEGYGPTVIEITYLSAYTVLAKTLRDKHGTHGESSWSIGPWRNWRILSESERVA